MTICQMTMAVYDELLSKSQDAKLLHVAPTEVVKSFDVSTRTVSLT